MGITRQQLIAARAQDGRSIHIKTARDPGGPAIATHWLSGPCRSEAIANAALDTQRAALYDIAASLVKVRSEDLDIRRLQQDARAVFGAVRKQLEDLKSSERSGG